MQFNFQFGGGTRLVIYTNKLKKLYFKIKIIME